MTIPRIDDRIKTVWVSYLRTLNGEKLRQLTDLLVIQHNEDKLAVIIPYAMFLELQAEILAGLARVQQLVPALNFNLPRVAAPDRLPWLCLAPCPNHPDDAELFCTMPMEHRGLSPHRGLESYHPAHSRCVWEADNNDMVAPIAVPVDSSPLRGFQPIVTSAQFIERGGVMVAPEDRPLCHHCSQPGTTLCPACFMSGHRGARDTCMACAPVAE